jgi:hypothetical protein
MYSVARGMTSGRLTLSRSSSCQYAASNSWAISGSVEPVFAARAMILSSTSVTLLANVTSKPRQTR